MATTDTCILGVLSQCSDCLSLYQELDEVRKQFELLQQKSSNQTGQDDAAERVKKIKDEAEKMKKEVEDKLQQIQGSISTLTVM